MKQVFLHQLLAVVFFLSLTHNFALATDKLIVKDMAGNTKFLVTDEGKVGVGTTNPIQQIHIREATNSLTAFRVENPFISGRQSVSAQEQVVLGPVGSEHLILQVLSDLNPSLPSVALLNTITHNFYIRTEGKNVFKVIKTGASENTLVLQNGKVGIGTPTPTHLLQLSGGAYSDGATWVDASSRELKENIKDVSVEEAVATLESLTPVQYNYKADKKEQHVGFIAEDVPDMVATKDRKGLSPMDVTAIITKVVQEQQKMIVELQGQIAELKTELQFQQDKRLAFSQVASHE